ncbi:Sister chromatid cohesion protein PDS5 [Cyberlindnera fabianii]|uniref:Sister chromatid cohesion protein PDS5 n=1 Tax=Cyberlindnera fabianii TaxID=36022 RepID=A0A1V2L9W0_CYBFA|nr:Sister chromatid cohesion protein PDS5 [Cyberlindnera fabianii]
MTRAQAASLQFKKSIISSAKDTISQKDLLERLDTLSTELSKIEQERFNVKSLDKYKDDLVNRKLLAHKDTGVQSLVACCLADVLRLYAPDAPYTDAELAEIFKLFIKMFKKLSDPENGYYSQQVYLITRLAEVRSIILVTDIESSSTLIENIFQMFYDQTNVFHKKLEPIISDILIEIISEWDQISSPVLKLILNKFLTRQTGTVTASLTTSSAQPFNFSINICNANPDRLARQLTKFFSETLYENTTDGEVDYKSLSKLHTLLVEAWKHVPEILASVMGLLDDELNADSDKFRALATETVGKVLASQSRVNFVTVHRDTWLSWMKKTLDISPSVRVKWVEQAAEVLVNRADVLAEITNGLSKTLIDTDEHVRLATVRAVSNIPSDVLLRKVHNSSILTGLGQLIREKHVDVREEAITIMGSLFKEAYEDVFAETEDELPDTFKIVKQIPSNLLNLYYINNTDINSLVDVVLIEDIFPEELDDMKRVMRLVKIVGTLDQTAKSAFLAFNKRQENLNNALRNYIKFCENLNGLSMSDDDTRAKFDKTVNWLAASLPVRFSPADALQKFATVNNRRMYQLVKWCVAADTEYKAMINARKELFTRIQSVKSTSSTSLKDMQNVFKLFMYRGGLTFNNRSNIAALFSLSDDPKYSKVAQDIVEHISELSPAAFADQVGNLVIKLKDTKITSKLNTVRALFHIFKKLEEYVPKDDNTFLDTLVNIAQSGTPLEATYAIRVLKLTGKIDLMGQLVFDAVHPLEITDKLCTHLASIAELFNVFPDIPEEYADDMTPILVRDILLANNTKAKKNDPDFIIDDEEVENGKQPELAAKIMALRVFTNRLLSLDKANTETEEVITTAAENVFKLLLSLIAKGGEIVNSKAKNYPSPRFFQAHLRLEAGLCLLKLAQVPRYNSLMKPVVINRVILLIQDENENIRSRFIRALTDSLKKGEISNRFFPSVYFMAYEPNAKLKAEVKTWIRSTFSKRANSSSESVNDIVFEKSITGLIHAIAHHAEFVEYIDASNEEPTEDGSNTSEENLLKAYTFGLEYLAFFLENVAMEKNISLIYYFATRVKQYRDATLPESAYSTEPTDAVNNIYRVSDLAQFTIRDLAESRGWTIQTYPGKLQLSTEIFAKMQSSEEGHRVAGTSYIQDTIIKRLGGIVKQKINSITTTKRVRSTEAGVQRKKSKTMSRATKPKATSKKYRKRTTSDEEGSDIDEPFGNPAEPVRKSSRAKRISYADQVNEYQLGEGEEEEDVEMDHEL